MVAMRPCNSDASLSQQVHMAAVVSNDRPNQVFYCGTIFTLAHQAHRQQANRCVVDQVLGCLVVFPASMHFQEIGRRHATGHIRHLLPRVDRSAVVYLPCRLLYQNYLSICLSDTQMCMHCGLAVFIPCAAMCLIVSTRYSGWAFAALPTTKHHTHLELHAAG